MHCHQILLFLLLLVFGQCFNECQRWNVSGLRTGKYVNIENYPYVVSIRYGKSRKVICTGIIVTLSWILTVPHCFMLTPDHYKKESDSIGTIPPAIESLAKKRNEPTFALFSMEGNSDIHCCRQHLKYGPFKCNKTLLTSTTHFPFSEEEIRKKTVILEPSIFEVIAGSSSIRDCSFGGQIRVGKEIIIHPNFKISQRKQRNPRHELALLKTDLPFVKRKSVATTPILQNFSINHNSSQNICKLVGWGKGKTVKPLPHLRTTLSEITVTLHKSNTCRLIENSYKRAIWDDDPEEWFCAYDEEYHGIPVCQSDSGGPLVCKGKVVGLLSWMRTPTCYYNSTDYFRYLPIYFTRIYLDLRWIQETLGASSLEMTVMREVNATGSSSSSWTGIPLLITMVTITGYIFGFLFKADH